MVYIFLFEFLGVLEVLYFHQGCIKFFNTPPPFGGGKKIKELRGGEERERRKGKGKEKGKEKGEG